MTILVAPLSWVDMVVRTRRPSHVITLLDPDHPVVTPAGIEAERHLKIGCWDLAEEWQGLAPPDETVVSRLLAFGRGWDAAAPILVHCWAGISRSTASAFVLACERAPGEERATAEALRRASRWATPNRRIVALADDALGRGGRMVDAAAAIGRGEPACEGRPFDLPVAR